MFDQLQPDTSRFRGGAVGSLVMHVGIILVAAGVFRAHVKLAAYKLPGTSQGTQYLTYYAPGSVHTAMNQVAVKTVEKKESALSPHPVVAQAKADPVVTPSAEKGIADAGQSGAGEGNITIALQKYFPYPKPSLETLPAGSTGDVILNAIIDEHGKITQLTVVRGLGPAIDNAVIATVNQWLYTPAMKDGVPVPSVEELHFHYERRG